MKTFTRIKLFKLCVTFFLMFMMSNIIMAQTYTKITNVEALEDGNFVVLYNGYGMNGHAYAGEENWYSMYEDQDGVLGANKLTLEDGVEIHSDYIWHIFNSQKDRYTIGRDGLYLKTNYSDAKGASDKDIEVGDDFTKKKQQWDVTYIDGKWKFQSHDEETNDRYLMYNHSNSGLDRFAAYDDPNEEDKKFPTAIYKVEDSTSSIGIVKLDNTIIYYFNLNGTRIIHPKHGIFVTSKGKKIYFK